MHTRCTYQCAMKPHPIAAVVLAAIASLSAACSKHDCKLEGQHEKYFGELALTTKGADMCFTGSNPSGCKVGDDRCSPSLTVWHYELDQKATEARYKTAFEGKGWKYVGEKASDDGSKSIAFSKGSSDELLVAFGDTPGGKGTEMFMLLKPEGATGTMLDKYK
jgi:hypothetical protein